MNLLNLIFVFCFVALVTSTQLSFEPQHGLTPLIKPKAKAARVFLDIIKQPLDHFDPQNKEEWNMRYMYNNQFFNPNAGSGPIFIMLGGEWTISTDMLQGGQMFDMAEQNGAFMFYTEHRFYGGSFPTEKLGTSDMEYVFNIDQALADVIYFVRKLKTEIPALKNSKVVVFGGSYSGNMAIWMRQKYPNDIFAAVASSAPILSKIEFSEYLEVVQTVLGNDCSDIISRAIDQILLLFGTPEGSLKVQKDFNTCRPVNTNKPLEVSHFFQVMTVAFGNLVQYDSCGKAKQLCDALINTPNMDPYSKLAALFTQGSTTCYPTYPDALEVMKNITVVPGQNGRQWFYQVCFQLGFMETTSSKNQPFRNTVPLSTYHGLCTDYFDTHVYNQLVNQQGSARTNMIYGGLKPNVTRVVSVHGRNDPWHKLGQSEDWNPLAPVIYVKGASHTFDLASINDCDNEEMIAAKKAVQRYIKGWLNSE